ncbi:MAG: prolipoprotein diacylglyceryl transferase [Lachnospiraceae bacterium]|nr:prolipoprotein diacylglyceryl transferase [Lachnospiraceae bacterium]
MMDFLRDNSKYLAILVGIAATYPLMWRMRRKAGTESWLQVLLMCIGFSAFSLLGTIAMANIEFLLRGETLSFGAVSVSGVYLVTPPILLLLCKVMKKDPKDIFDLFAVYVLPTLFLMRINCILSGCCLGKRIGDSAFRWPVRELEMVFYAVFLVYLLRRGKEPEARGKLFPLLMVSYGVFRFLEEFFRESTQRGPFHLAHVWAAVMFLIGFSFLTENSRVRKPKRLK